MRTRLALTGLLFFLALLVLITLLFSLAGPSARAYAPAATRALTEQECLYTI